MSAERMQLVVLVQPGTKQRLKRCSDVTGISITRMLEQAADQFEAQTLERLKPAQRKRYLAAELTALEAFGKNQLLGKTMPDVPRVVVSALVSAEAKEKLDRYARFWSLPLNNVVYRLARNWEKRVLAVLKPEQHADFLAGKLHREAMFPPVENGDDEDNEE